MPQWEYKCSNCGRDEVRWFASFEQMQVFEQTHPVRSCKPNPKTGRCGGHMIRQPSASAFSVQGYNAHNGYSNGYSREG